MAWLTVLGIPAAIYVASMIALFFRLLDRSIPWIAVLGSGFMALGLYTLHRSWIKHGPNMQKRHLLAIRYTTQLKTLSVFMLVLAAVCLLMLHGLLLILLIVAIVGIFAYGRETFTQPLRNYTFLKPLEVGGGIAILVWFYAGMPTNYLLVAGLMLICTADALLCDLVDRQYDLEGGCITLAYRLGTVWTWIVAFGMYGLALTMLQPPIGVLFVVLFPLPIALYPIDLRFLVDIRPALVLLIAWAV